MAPRKGDSSSGSTDNEKRTGIHEWAIPNVGRLNIVNRNIGSTASINLMFTFPNPGSLDIDRLSARITDVQQLWPLLSVTVVDQRTTTPKMQYRYSSWDPDRILVHETYDPHPTNPQADRDALYEKALRLFQLKVSYDDEPLWRAFVFRASTDPENNRVYLALTFDHVIMDGRGAVNLARALVAKDISQLPKEDITLYEKAGLGQDMDILPPYSFIASLMVQGLVYPRLPGFLQRWLGHYPTWPQRIERPTIDIPWKSSIVDIPIDVIKTLKAVGTKHGTSSLNAILHTAWAVAIWTVFLRREKDEKQMLRAISIKDLRDPSKGDPYCVGGNPTAYIWSSGLLTEDTRFWAMAKTYAAGFSNPQSFVDGLNMMKMLNVRKDEPFDPDQSKHRVPDSQELPVGDKRPHTLRGEEALEKINSLTPYTGMSGIWSNLSYVDLPDGAIGAVIGAPGTATQTAYNTVLIAHKNGTSVQNAFSDGAAMREEDVKDVEKLFLNILRSIIAEQDKDWLLHDLVDSTSPIRAKL